MMRSLQTCICDKNRNLVQIWSGPTGLFNIAILESGELLEGAMHQIENAPQFSCVRCCRADFGRARRSHRHSTRCQREWVNTTCQSGSASFPKCRTGRVVPDLSRPSTNFFRKSSWCDLSMIHLCSLCFSSSRVHAFIAYSRKWSAFHGIIDDQNVESTSWGTALKWIDNRFE
jgi:hypothetical protein